MLGLADVAKILDDIRDEGISAVLRYTELFDGVSLTEEELVTNPLKLPPPVIDSELKEAIDFAVGQVRRFHRAVRPENQVLQGDQGMTLSERWIPLSRVGLYVPNGRYPLVSSLIMTAVPAIEAGVGRIVVALPPRARAALDAPWLYVLQTLGISELLSLGGAQAIGALAYGIEGLESVDFIAGPGNRFVTEAKMEVQRRGLVGVDGYAGPSEVMIIANQRNWADIVWADLSAQAEHDPLARGELVTHNPELAAEIRARAENLPDNMGAITVREVSSLDEAITWANQRAPEHLGLMGDDVVVRANDVLTAGALFLGPMAGQALGDYVAGPSHVLPTGGRGRFQSGLTTRSFCRRMSVIQADWGISAKVLEMGRRLAALEGLSQHERSMALRLQERRDNNGTEGSNRA